MSPGSACVHLSEQDVAIPSVSVHMWIAVGVVEAGGLGTQVRCPSCQLHYPGGTVFTWLLARKLGLLRANVVFVAAWS